MSRLLLIPIILIITTALQGQPRRVVQTQHDYQPEPISNVTTRMQLQARAAYSIAGYAVETVGICDTVNGVMIYTTRNSNYSDAALTSVVVVGGCERARAEK